MNHNFASHARCSSGEEASSGSQEGMMVSRIFTSWNRLTTWLRQVERLRLAA